MRRMPGFLKIEVIQNFYKRKVWDFFTNEIYFCQTRILLHTFQRFNETRIIEKHLLFSYS